MFRSCFLLPSIRGNGWTNIFSRFLHKNYYEILKLNENCTPKDIKEAFITMSKKYHPDRCKDSDSQKKFVEVAEAYSVLIKPMKRKNHDLDLEYVKKRNSYDYKGIRYTYETYPSYVHSESFGARERMFYKDYYEKQRRQSGYYSKENEIKRIDKKIMLIICGFIIVVGAYIQFIAIRGVYKKIQILRKRRDVANEAIVTKLESKAETVTREERLRKIMEKHRADIESSSNR